MKNEKTKLKIDIITIFPEIFTPLKASIVKRAQEKGLLKLNIINLRDFTSDKHRTVDEPPYGGSGGMVLKIEPICKAIKKLKKNSSRSKTYFLCPQGEKFTQKKALKLSKESHLILICGHYEGIDERINYFVDGRISVGDYVLTGGELPAMIVVDCVARLIPGVIDEKSLKFESFNDNLLDFPHYTRPAEFKGYKVPEVLTSGNHAAILKWRKEQSLKNTRLKRPDLLQ